MKLYFVPGVLLAISSSCWAMSLREAGENLLYFEHAKTTSEHCERQIASVRSAYEMWLRDNSALYAETVGTIRRNAEQGGLSKAEQEAVLREAIGNQRALAQEHIAKKGVNCQRFSASLQMYSSLLKR
ncbi:hypothetical protein MCEMSHM24_03761 [Comamonadaceae bacterium]